MQFARHFLASLKREPAFAAIFIVPLALGVGANAALIMALAALIATAVPSRRARRADLLSLLRPQ